MQWKRAHVVLVCAKGTNNNSLYGYVFVYYYAEEAGEIVLSIEVAREFEMILALLLVAQFIEPFH